MTQSNLRREGFIPLHGLVSIMKGGQGKNLRQEPGRRNWSRGHRGSLLAGLLFKACSSCLLIWPRTTRPGQHYSHGPGPATSFIKRGARFSLTPHSVQWVGLNSDSHFCYKCDNNKKKKNKKFPYRIVYRQSDGDIPHLKKFIFPDNSSMCQIEEKINQDRTYF